MERQSIQFQIKRICYCALFTTLAMIFSYVENLIPFNFGIPGMKLGLANLVTVTGLYFLNPVDVLIVVFLRIVLTGFMFGNGMSIIYSLAGGIVSFACMVLVKKIKRFSMIGVSIIGGVTHNLGQIIVAMLVVETFEIVYYFPVLAITGSITGMLIGIVGIKIVKILRINEA